jgi:uncharacterized membrane protein YedE/YeeE
MSDEIKALIGGAAIGLASLIALMASGKIPGVSGIIAKTIRPRRGDVLWRVIFLIGLVAGGWLSIQFLPDSGAFIVPGNRGLVVFAIAGLLVGFGTRLGGGCTSGHGICGIGAGAKDAIIYTAIFMAAAVLTVLIWKATGGIAKQG